MLDFTKKANIAYKLSLFLYVVQISLIFISTAWLVPTHQQPTLIVGVVFSIPLLILLPWLIKRNIRAFVWLCFIELGYFMPATQHMFMFEQYGWMPFLETFVIISQFVIAMLFSRWEQKKFGISVTR
jgi:uncharacterized membrane protein